VMMLARPEKRNASCSVCNPICAAPKHAVVAARAVSYLKDI